MFFRAIEKESKRQVWVNPNDISTIEFLGPAAEEMGAVECHVVWRGFVDGASMASTYVVSKEQVIRAIAIEPVGGSHILDLQEAVNALTKEFGRGK